MRFARTNIAARDWEKLSQFYEDVFDCTVKPPRRKLSGEWLDSFHPQMVFLPNLGVNRRVCLCDVASYVSA